MRKFGLRRLSDETPTELDKILSQVERVEGFLAKIVTMESYDETFGIADYGYDDPSRPFALVGMHPKEEYIKSSRLERLIKAFRKHNVHKYYGIGLQEFLNNPTHINQIILEDCRECEDAASKTADGVMRELDQQMR